MPLPNPSPGLMTRIKVGMLVFDSDNEQWALWQR